MNINCGKSPIHYRHHLHPFCQQWFPPPTPSPSALLRLMLPLRHTRLLNSPLFPAGPVRVWAVVKLGAVVTASVHVLAVLAWGVRMNVSIPLFGVRRAGRSPQSNKASAHRTNRIVMSPFHIHLSPTRPTLSPTPQQQLQTTTKPLNVPLPPINAH